MSASLFTALVVRENQDGGFSRRIEERAVEDLPQGDLLVRVRYSSLNYKDALSATGNRGVTRRYPHTPGIDAAGLVEESAHPGFKPGDEVIVTSYDLGMNTSGGFGQFIRTPAEWAVPRPEGLTLRESMMFGTAGFTAALSVQRLLDHGLVPDQGQVLVTGATGGVGGFAVSILAKAGFSVAAVSGKPEAESYLKELGAARMVPRSEMDDPSGKALLPAQFAGVIDTVGGNILATALKSVATRAGVTCCGNAASPQLNTTVFPFILRGISLYGIDSANCPMALRRRIWNKIAKEWKLAHLESMVRERSLSQLEPEIEKMLRGGQKGRILINLG